MSMTRIDIWRRVEDAVIDAIATIAVQLIETGAVYVVSQLQEAQAREQQKPQPDQAGENIGQAV